MSFKVLLHFENMLIGCHSLAAHCRYFESNIYALTTYGFETQRYADYTHRVGTYVLRLNLTVKVLSHLQANPYTNSLNIVLTDIVYIYKIIYK